VTRFEQTTEAAAWALHAAASNGFGDAARDSFTTRRTTMQAQLEPHVDDARTYAKCVEASKRIRWEIERDVIRGRTLEAGKKFMPDGMSHVDRLPFLSPRDQMFFSQIRVEPTPTCLGWSSVSSAPRCSR
jgi:hypothetical protein